MVKISAHSLTSVEIKRTIVVVGFGHKTPEFVCEQINMIEDLLQMSDTNP